MAFHVDSEVGRLRSVLLLRPELSLKRLTPTNAAGLLFDDVLIVALRMPRMRAFMHLDTVMTMVDHGVFTAYAGLGLLPSHTVEPGDTEKDLKRRCSASRAACT